ncbi:MAG: diguanylate cyclase/phosphodiesterase with PAS/PAC and MHYT sensor(s), partial [Elusimicrobia bacterium]
MPARPSSPFSSLDILRWTTAFAVFSISAPAAAIALHQDLALHRHLFLVGIAWVVTVAVLLAALRIHRLRLVEETRRADDELKGVRSRFEALTQGIGNDFFLYEHDASGVFIYLSPSLPAILGWSPEEFKAHYTTYLTDHPVNRAVVAHTEGSLAGVQQEPYSVEVRHKDGAARWLEVYEVPVLGPDRTVASVFGIARDRTKSRKAEAELLQVRAAVDQALDAVAIADLDGHIRFANKSWARLHGYEPSELTGRHLSMFHTPEQMERDVRPFNEAVARSGSHSGEVGHAHRDGSLIPTAMNTAIYQDADGKPNGLIGVARDLREARQRDTALRELLDSLDEFVFVATAERRVGFLNAAFRAAVGGRMSAGADAAEAFAPESRPFWESALEAALRGESPAPLRLALLG